MKLNYEDAFELDRRLWGFAAPVEAPGFAVSDGIAIGTSVRDLSGEGLAGFVRRSLYGSGAYDIFLRNGAPENVLGTPPALQPGDPEIGRAILNGAHTRHGKHVPLPMLAKAGIAETGVSRYAQEFGWLADLRALGTDEARDFARQAIVDWLDIFGRWHPYTWRAAIVGNRLVNWLTHYGFFGWAEDDPAARRFLKVTGSQVRHLSRSHGDPRSGYDRLAAAKGLIYAGIALSDCGRHLDTGLNAMREELEAQILPDGGHASRSPGVQARVLEDLISIRDAFRAAHLDPPDWLLRSIPELAAALRALRRPDGALAGFNGGPAISVSALGAILSASKSRAGAAPGAPHAGFHRLAAGDSHLILDAGAPPPAAAHPWGHAGTLSFELVSGREPLIVNCGSGTDGDPHWREALRTSAAHSTVIVDETNSSEIDPAGGFSRRCTNAAASRREAGAGVILDASHDGYVLPFGLTHRRLIMMAPSGEDIRGEDYLIGAGGRTFAVRFHLHPDVRASMLGNGRSVLLKLRRSGWRFDAQEYPVCLEDSVFRTPDGRTRRSRQVVIHGGLGGTGATIIWRLSRPAANPA